MFAGTLDKAFEVLHDEITTTAAPDAELISGTWKFTWLFEAPMIGAGVPPTRTQIPRKFTGTCPFTRSPNPTLWNVAGPPKLVPFTVAIPSVDRASTGGVLNPAPSRMPI